MHAHKISIYILLLSLSGCLAPDFFWQPTGKLGPFVTELEQVKILQKCDSGIPMADTRRCHWAFMTPDNKKTDIFGELAPELDAYVSGLPEFLTWPNKYGGKFPAYKFSLLTIRPAIVILSPIPSKLKDMCNQVPTMSGRCIRSRAISNGYDFLSSLPIEQGSYWFSPGKTTGLIPLPTDLTDYMFPINGIDARIVRDANEWIFLRKY